MTPPARDAAPVEFFFQLVHSVGPVVEDGSGQRRIGAAIGQHAHEMLGLAGAAGSDHRNVRGARDGARQSAIEAVLDAIGIHGSEQDLARAQFLAARGPLDGVDAFVVASAARVDVPAAGAVTARVNRQHHRLRAELLREFGDQLGTAHRGGVDRHFVGARKQNTARIGALSGFRRRLPAG